jgi:deoxyribodipyrimidine photo-lyase
MIESLEELNSELGSKNSRLIYFYGSPHTIIDKLIRENDIEAVYVNMDYTPYSIKRDKRIESICNKHNIYFNSDEDVLLNPVCSIRTGNNEIYQKFTPYFNKAKKIKVRNVESNNRSNYINKRNKLKGEFKGDIHKFYSEYNEDLAIIPGRKEAIKTLKNIVKFKNYNSKRNDLTYTTTRLSAYIKFGCLSIREVYYAFKNKLSSNNDLIKQLYWRDFYYNIAYEYSHIFSRKGNLKTNYDKIKWDNNRTLFNRWKDGKTGFPIVDAAMTEMNTTGFMHNRARLIVSSFLIKLLLVDWKWGEKYFAKTLVDYDPSVNTGNWGWASGSGADAQPYFRIFNPWLQGEKYDPNCEYIKKWIPELKDVDNKHIHKWYDNYDEYDVDYYKPIIDYNKSKNKGINAYKVAFR